MDLAKAKSVIITILVAFNIFLLVNNLTFSNKQGVSKETIKNTEAILKARGVTFECKIPRTSKAKHWLEFGNGRLDRTGIAAKLLGEPYTVDDEGKVFESAGKKLEFLSDTEFVFTGVKPDFAVKAARDGIVKDREVKKAAKKFLMDKGLWNDKYVMDHLERNQDGSTVIKFIESYGGFLLFDNYCNITVAAGDVARLEYGKREIIGFSDIKLEEPSAAYQVLLAHFKEGGGQVITNIDIGYKYPDDYVADGVEGLAGNMESPGELKFVELLPVWRIKIKGAAAPVYLGTIYADK